jgi:peptidoglycan/LPS O-acetylase OafA/YrhL
MPMPPDVPAGKLRSLEALRGVAALTVALNHAGSTVYTHPLLPFRSDAAHFEFPAQPGLEFFFALSGFVMVLIHLSDFGQAARVPPFLWRRVSRIYPMYWLVLVIMLWQFWAILPDATTWWVGWFTLWPFTWHNVVPVAWSLRLEMAFYLILALCMLPRVGPWVLALWIGATAFPTLGLLPWSEDTPLRLLVNPFNVDFFAGLVAGLAYRKTRPTPRQSAALLVGGLAGAFVGLWLMDWGLVWGGMLSHIILSASFGCVIIGCGKLEQAGSLRLGSWATLCGLASYPLYLTHLLVFDGLTRPFGTTGLAAALGPNLTLLALLAASVAVAVPLGLADRRLQRLLRWRPPKFAPGAAVQRT